MLLRQEGGRFLARQTPQVEAGERPFGLVDDHAVDAAALTEHELERAFLVGSERELLQLARHGRAAHGHTQRHARRDRLEVASSERVRARPAHAGRLGHELQFDIDVCERQSALVAHENHDLGRLQERNRDRAFGPGMGCVDLHIDRQVARALQARARRLPGAGREFQESVASARPRRRRSQRPDFEPLRAGAGERGPRLTVEHAREPALVRLRSERQLGLHAFPRLDRIQPQLQTLHVGPMKGIDLEPSVPRLERELDAPVAVRGRRARVVSLGARSRSHDVDQVRGHPHRDPRKGRARLARDES